MDDRRLTLIVVPHGDLETRTLEVSYRWLKVIVAAAVVLAVLFIVMASSWWYVAAQAAQVPGLKREVAQLEEERAQVAELARSLEQVEAQYQRVRDVLGVNTAPEEREFWLPPLRDGEDGAGREGGDPFRPDGWPLSRSGYITRELTDSEGPLHPGVDIAVPNDSYIRAAGAGVVQEAARDDVYGNYVLLDHRNGFASMYGHASRLFVAPGDTVERYEVIALSGSTGRSTAPHLHFELRRNGDTIDPLTILRQP